MAAQVELKTGEGTRAGVVGGRMHLSPLADSSNKSPVEVPSSTQGPLILAPEPSKPVPGPKPRLTPKPFALDKNPTIRPIPAPKPHTKPRPELTRPASYKPDPPSTPKPALTKPAHASAHRPVPTNPKRPTPTSLKPAPKPAPAHTAKPTVQPYKPAPPPSSGEPAKLTLREAVKSPGPRPGLLQKRGSRAPPAAEWSGTTQQEGERARTEASGRVGAPIARAKSLGFLNQTSQEDEKPSGGGKGGEAAAAPVPMRPQPKGSRPRPVSAVFLPSPTQSESPGPPAPSRWTGRRPLSADLTAKFESIGLSLHRRPGKADSKENTPERGREEDGAPAQRKDKEKGVELTPSSPSMFLTTPDPEYKPMPTVPEQKNERKEPEEKEEEKSGGSIKRRISLLFDSSSSSAVGGLSVAGAEPRPAAAQPIPETDVPVGVKQRIKKLIEDTPPTQTPSPKAPFKPRPLPSDLTKKFAAENLVELSSLSPRSLEREGSKGQQQDGSEAHGKVEDSAMGLTDGAREAKEERVVFQFPQDQPAYTSTDQSGVSMEERRVESEAQEACPSGGVQTVRAALFENVVERHSVHVVEEAGGGAGQLRRSISLRQKEGEDDGQGGIALTGATAPASPLRVEHVFDTVSAIGEKRAVVESLPPAQLEDKAMTLRSRRSGAEGMARGGHVEDKPQQPHSPRDPPRAKPEATSLLPEQAPRYLRVGGLKKWGTEEVKREGQAEPEAEVGLWGESDRQKPESAMQFESEIERQREWEREEVGAPKRLKMLEGDDPQPKPRATYFALTGQMQEPQPVDNYSVEGSGGEDITVGDFSAKFGRWGSQGPVRRNPSLDAAFASSLSEASGQGSLAGRDQTPKEREAFREMETEQELKTQRDMEWERQRELEQLRATEREKETERQRETERQMEVETERRREMERQKEMETQRELERQRERVRGMERQLLELEKQRQAEKVRLERQRETERQKEMERQLLELEKQRRAEREKAERRREMERQRELERQRQQEIEKLREMERQRELERQREMERQKEMERQLLELEKQRRAEREKAERQRAMERQRELERERQQEIEKLREMERQRDMERQRELERQREMERQKEMERQLLELEKQRRAEREKAERQREMERQLDIERQKFLEFEKRKDIEMERREEIEREKQREIERAGQREMENRRQRELERVRQEMERQKETARQREIERQKEMERQLLELEKQRRAEREKEREAKEKEQERVRQLLRQQDMERQRAMEREREIVKREEVMSTLRPGVLDLDSVSLADQHLKVSQSSDPRLKLPSPHNEDTYRLAILDIDSFRSQTHPAPPIEAFPAVGIQGLDSGATLWSQPHTTEERPVGRPSPVWSSSQLEFWEQTAIAPGSWLAPEPPQKPASKPSLEQLLLGQEERLAAPSLVPERQWSGLPADSGSTSAWAPFPRRETTGSSAPESHRHGYTDPAPLESPWVLRDPVTPVAQEQRAEPRTQQGQQGPHAKDLTRTRSRSVSRRSAPAESPLEGPLSRMRSRSAHRETDIRSWEQLKQCVGAEDEGRDTDTLVQETDSQYGTWDTGLRTDDSLTPNTPSSDSNLSSSPRKQTPPHTPGDPATPSGFDTPDSLSPGPVPETEPLPFPETTTTLLDSSALRSRVQLGKMRNKRALPSRAARQNAALSVPQEGQGGAGDDWRYRDSTEEKGQSSRQEDSDPEEQPRGAELRPPASLPQRVALFPGMDPSALKAQLKKRGDSDNQTDGASPSSSQLSRSPKSPFLARASRVLPPAGGKENGEESSPQWLRELKSKKRLSQYENDT